MADQAALSTGGGSGLTVREKDLIGPTFTGQLQRFSPFRSPDVPEQC